MIEIPGYRLLRQLGRGGMATVYLAVQESVDREVALKIMSPALLADPNFGERFLREAKIAARLHHRHVVGIHDVGRAGDYHYIAMEYLGGGAVLAKDGSTREPAFALRVTREIAGALGYAQEKGFVHRDVKPDNILLRDDGSAALTDFGIARALDSTLRMTKTGAVVGTPHYMSPEQARGKSVDGRSDLYALGVVLYEMLVGRVPYQADDSLAIGIMHITQPVPTLPESIAVLQPLVSRLLAKQPEERYQNGQEAAVAIAEIERRMANGALPELDHAQPAFRRDTPLESFRATEPSPPPPAAGADRAEPSLGRIDQIVAALDGDGVRAERNGGGNGRTPRKRAPRNGLLAAGAVAVLAIGALVAWNYQDRLRALLPRTEFNDTLSRAQRALDAGKLTGNDSARELFLAARAQDPDNDVARRGLDAVGHKLLDRADEALKANDPVAARQALGDARELLGGGSEVERLEAALKQGQSNGDEVSDQLAAARNALDAGKISGSGGAAELYQRVLAGDKNNALAQAGLQKAADALAAQARDALATKDVATAAARSDEIARILPAYAGLPDLLGQIAKAREAERAALEETVARAEAQLRAGRIAGGEDGALDQFRAVLKQDPANARAKAGLRKVAQAFVVQASAAIEDDNAGSADRLLAQAAELAPDLPDLRAARVNLRELRERLAIGAQRAALTPAQTEQVHRLVAEASAAAAAGNVMIPPGDSAYDKYRAALAIDGNDRAALDGIARLPARAKELFAQALTDAAPQRAHALLDSVRQIAPDDPAIASMSEKLANAFLDQADLRIGEGRRADAARALNSARELSPGNARLASLEARVQALAEKP
ncbi:serine/threonine-protein kinase [Dokdonella sp.]|uniref:serine/threonine-protein kinase n=1 Tax=Dokdonella sp. TaxID=2291710 RepID=UPI001B0E787A|nr:serine/threonine-protein kinase [Dokdonella sp.]MBO9664718.1 serine/threonine protein kinase [Dokdonella sp.]